MHTHYSLYIYSTSARVTWTLLLKKHKLKLQKEVVYTQKQPDCKKSAALVSVKKSYEIKVGGQEIVVMV